MKKINCKEIREEILTNVKDYVSDFEEKPRLVVVQVGNDPASNTYIKNKKKTCYECGIECIHQKIDITTPLSAIEALVRYYAEDKETTGIIVQLPLPDALKHHEQDIIDIIPWYKDVDGLTTENVGRLWSGRECIVPATAAGVLKLIPSDLSGKTVALIGRSKLCNIPLMYCLQKRGATPTLCHSKTSDLKGIVSNSNYVVSAIGHPKFFDETWFYYKDTIFIDVGINRDADGNLCGDLDPRNLNEYCRYTPVPGGVGILTTAMLAANVVEAHKIQKEKR